MYYTFILYVRHIKKQLNNNHSINNLIKSEDDKMPGWRKDSSEEYLWNFKLRYNINSPIRFVGSLRILPDIQNAHEKYIELRSEKNSKVIIEHLKLDNAIAIAHKIMQQITSQADLLRMIR